MSDLTILEKRKLEKLLQMGSGYVLNFSNRTLDEFIIDSVGKSIYEAKYEEGGNSKANRLRTFWKIEPNHVVGKLLKDLLDYYRSEYFDTEVVNSGDWETFIDECSRIASRLLESAPVPEITSIVADKTDKGLSVLAKSVKEYIEKNEPELGLDRLHTFIVKYIRMICAKRGITTEQNKSLHSLVGEYVKSLKEKGEIESVMTERILKSNISVLESFNQVRNTQSLAHDNPILNYEESLLIFNQVIHVMRFIDALEKSKSRTVPVT